MGDSRIELSGTGPTSAGTPAPPEPTGRAARWKLAGLLALLALPVAALLFVWAPVLLDPPEPVSVSGDKVMLAVLPFQNLSGDAEQEFFSDGVTEEVIARLGRLSPQRMGVIARTSAMRYKDTDKAIDQIGRELGVDYILEGSVRRAGGRVRITAQLIQAADQTHLWAQSYDRSLEEVLAIQGDVAARVARSLQLELLPGHEQELDRAATTDPAAHEAYLRGLYHGNRRTGRDIRLAIGHFEEAVAIDPEFARGHAALATAWTVLPDYSDYPVRDAVPQIREAAGRALALDAGLVEARAALAMADRSEYLWADALRQIREAVGELPGYATGHQWHAWMLTETGRHDEAVEAILRAREMDPRSAIINSNVAQMLFYAGRCEEALPEFERALEMAEDLAVALRHLGLCLADLGRHDEAIALLEELQTNASATAHALEGLAYTHAKAGHREEAERLLAAARSRPGGMTGAPAEATILVALGREDEAMAALERSYREGESLLRILTFPGLEALRPQPRFRQLLRDLGLAARGAAQ